MNRHHPKDTTLAEFAAGTLDEGRSLVVATHLAMCAHCRGFVSALDHMGGEMLAQIEPVAMEASAAQVLAQLDRQEDLNASGPADFRRGPAPNRRAVWQPEQKTLLGYDLGPWRWVSPGLHYRAVNMPHEYDTRIFMLKAKPGLKIPQHKHTGTELTCVLAGAFIHEGGRYGPGDCDDADQDDGHTPVIDEGDECVCLVAMQGQIQLTGFFGRMIQPLLRI